MSSSSSHNTGDDNGYHAFTTTHADEPDCVPRAALILYATESGNAEEAAQLVRQRLEACGFHVRVFSADLYPPENFINESLVLFIISTTGAGKEPRTFTPLWTSLCRADLPSDIFEDLKFGVFGLGDTAYERFCWPAKLLQRRLESLGATSVVDRGEGDDQHRLGIDGALLPWVRSLEVKLDELHPPEVSSSMYRQGGLHAPSVLLKPIGHVSDLTHNEFKSKFLAQSDRGIGVNVLKNERTTSKDWEQDVRHIVFSLPRDTTFSPGDLAVIYSSADPASVSSVLEAASILRPDDLFDLVPSQHVNLPPRLPLRVTIRDLLTHHLSFSSVPRRTWFELVAHFASDEQEAQKLREFGAEDGDGADDMYEYATRPRRTIAEVLQDFHSIVVPTEYLFDIFPPVRPRLFSIANSLRKHPGELHLLAAIVRFRTTLRAPRVGACTSYLARLGMGDCLTIEIRKGDSGWEAPLEAHTPVICIGPGTGVAPMRALIQDRVALGSSANELYFGCRHAHSDQHFAAEWEQMVRDQVLSYHLAASRDGLEGTARVYVQHLLAQRKEHLARGILMGGKIYVCGAANKMPLEVRKAVIQALEAGGPMHSEKAEDYVRRMERDGRWVEECWT